MTAPQERPSGSWDLQAAEDLLLSLKGVVSARVVARPGGDVEEIHLLTDSTIRPKQTVRNVESALLAQFGLEVDHRKISVAQSADAQPGQIGGGSRRDRQARPRVSVLKTPAESGPDRRLLFHSHQVETERSRRVRHRVELIWMGERYEGEAAGADLPRARLEAVAEATLHAVESAMGGDENDSTSLPGGSNAAVRLALDGVRSISAFDRTFILVAVHAVGGRDVVPLAGATLVEESPDRATILATLQATDRWVRGRI